MYELIFHRVEYLVCSEGAVDVFDQTLDLLLCQLVFLSDVFGCCVSHSAIRFMFAAAQIRIFSEINKK